ncbi:hydroxyacid dehydrogenase [Virgisporangium aliadipatigenens]|uniref:hydroxyacid dehydrogenase n=1 Tax=Virgisporangium aliadipatigenens TaxID=741659 RepID=UPI001EF3CDE0|nr:hydroxyacid dehydrogenase [Virgisporangium aliadipatigenens]
MVDTSAPSGSRPVAAFAMASWARDSVFPPDVRDRLTRLVDLDPAVCLTTFEGAEAVLGRAEILVTGWGSPRVDERVLAMAPRLRAVIHAAGTVKNHLDPAVFARGLLVSSAADANAVPVAEYTVAALVLAAKQAFTRARLYGAGEARGWSGTAAGGLTGCTVGVLGASRIGRLVLARLAAFDVTALLYDPYVAPAEARLLGAEPVDLDTLCRRSDLLTVHAPELPETRHLLDERRLGLMRDGAVLVNTARGSIVDTEALTRRCAANRMSAVLDVTDPEPLPAGHPLTLLPNVFITPHLAGAQGREQRRLGEFATDEVERLLRGRPLRGAVRAEDLPVTA